MEISDIQGWEDINLSNAEIKQRLVVLEKFLENGDHSAKKAAAYVRLAWLELHYGDQ